MEQAELIEGGEFSSFQELSKSIKKWEEANFVILYTRSSRSLESARRRAPRRTGLGLSLASQTLYRLVPARSKGSGHPCTHFGDFPHDSWGTVLTHVLLIGNCGFFTLP